MNIRYLLNILNLYKDYNIKLVKYNNDIKFIFNNNINTKTILFDYNLFLKNKDYLINKISNNSNIIDEKYDYDSYNDICYYYVKYSNNKTISFNNFNLDDINKIRNKNLKFDNEYNNYKLSYGFSNFKLLLLILFALIIILLILVLVLK